MADFVWLKRAGGMLVTTSAPHRFNAGEKACSGGACVPGLLVVASGWCSTSWCPAWAMRGDMQVAHMVHATASIIMMSILAGHIYMGTVGVKGAYEPAKTGYTDEAWAKEHHELWYDDDIKAGKIPGPAQPATRLRWFTHLRRPPLSEPRHPSGEQPMKKIVLRLPPVCWLCLCWPSCRLPAMKPKPRRLRLWPNGPCGQGGQLQAVPCRWTKAAAHFQNGSRRQERSEARCGINASVRRPRAFCAACCRSTSCTCQCGSRFCIPHRRLRLLHPQPKTGPKNPDPAAPA